MIPRGKRTPMADDHGPRSMLLVVDVQNGFVNEHTRHIIDVVNALIGAFSGRGEQVAFTRFVNIPGSGHERWMGWTRFMHEPENALDAAVVTATRPLHLNSKSMFAGSGSSVWCCAASPPTAAC
jgi:nicotinamidase-related amidase